MGASKFNSVQSYSPTLCPPRPDVSPWGMTRTVFIVSDHTGLTAENIARALLVHFPDHAFHYARRPFVKDTGAAASIVQETRHLAGQPRPLLFHTITNPEVVDVLTQAEADIFDLLTHDLERLSAALDSKPKLEPGGLHDMQDSEQYASRMEALDFALYTDDGVNGKQYGLSDVILVAVSRAGKTPTSLYLALQHGIRASNYPLTDEDLENEHLPRLLEEHRPKLFGLTIDPRRLHSIRQQRRPNSHYASLENCEQEVRHAEKLFRRYGIPVRDTTSASVEEIAAGVLAVIRGK